MHVHVWYLLKKPFAFSSRCSFRAAIPASFWALNSSFSFNFFLCSTLVSNLAVDRGSYFGLWIGNISPFSTLLRVDLYDWTFFDVHAFILCSGDGGSVGCSGETRDGGSVGCRILRGVKSGMKAIPFFLAKSILSGGFLPANLSNG